MYFMSRVKSVDSASGIRLSRRRVHSVYSLSCYCSIDDCVQYNESTRPRHLCCQCVITPLTCNTSTLRWRINHNPSGKSRRYDHNEPSLCYQFVLSTSLHPTCLTCDTGSRALTQRRGGKGTVQIPRPLGAALSRIASDLGASPASCHTLLHAPVFPLT